MNAALLIIAATIVGVLLLGLRARHGKDMNLEQWTVGGRGFGTILVFVLMAGEIYKPGFLALPAQGESLAWFDSTVLLTALGFYMWPHAFGSLYTARDERAFRRNAAMLPLYQLILLFVFFVGFAAILKVPGLQCADIDLSLLRLSERTFDPWFIGVIGAAGVLTAIVPGSMILLTSATLLANNIFRRVQPHVAEETISRTAKICVPVMALVSVIFTLRGGTTIVALLLMGYSFVTQLFPTLIASLLPHNPVTKEGAFTGICVGVATVAATSLTHLTMAVLFPGLPEALRDLNIGIIALVLNLLSLGIVSAVTRRRAVGAFSA